MALTNLDKNTINNLFAMLNINEKNDIEIIKKNNTTFSKLELIAKQVNFLRNEADDLINNVILTDKLNSIEMNRNKIPGTFYYHYIFDNKEILSIISPDEWNTYSEYLGKYYFNYDYLFYKH